MAKDQTPLLYAGVTIAAVAGGWWLIGRLRQPGIISQAQAEAFALPWAQDYAFSSSLTLVGQTRTVYFVGKPPLMSSGDWALVGGTPTRAFYYVEFVYVGLDEFLTVMIDAITGLKPPVSQGWVAGPMDLNFGL